MYIKEIELKDFRNYKEINVSFSSKVNIFIGNNGQGKTNLLEGIYFNSFGKSFKKVRDKEVIRFGEEYCRINTVAVIDDDENKVEIVISKDGKKGIKVNRNTISKASEIVGNFPVIIFSPEDLRIVKDEPERRRRFIDRELCQIRQGYLSDLNSYKRLLKQRNSYLKEIDIDENYLFVLDMNLAAFGSSIIKKRIEFINKTEKISSEIHDILSGGKEKLRLHYEPNIEIDEKTEEKEIEEVFLEMLLSSRDDDIRNRSTSKGPHKDDIKISANNIDLRRFGSQGQQRTAALSLKLSEIKIIEEEKNIKPVLLLDDVLSELDSDRQKYLITSLGDNQMFITTTDIMTGVIKDLEKGKIFKIRDGEFDIEI